MTVESTSRGRRRRVAAVLMTLAACLVLGLGAALLSGVPAPWVAQAPGTIYVYATAEPMVTGTFAGSATPGSAPTPTADATMMGSDPTVASTAVPVATAAPTVPAATARPAATPTPTPTQAPRPNLRYGVFALASATCSFTYTQRVWVQNDGPVASPASSVRFTDTYSGHVAFAATLGFGSLAPGATAHVDFTLTISAGCGEPHVRVLLIDPDNAVPETNETDNLFTSPYTPTARPNLYPTDLTIASAPCGVPVPVGVRVRNNGSAATPLVAWVTFKDTYPGDPAYSKPVNAHIPVIAAGGNAIVTTTLMIDRYCGHTHTLTATVDSTSLIFEASEADNVTSRNYSVLAP